MATPFRDPVGPSSGPPQRTAADVPPLTTAMVAIALSRLCNDDGGLYTMEELLAKNLIGPAAVGRAVRAMLASADVSAAKLVRPLERSPQSLPVLWPVLVESIRCAAATPGRLPRWLNRILDVALTHRPHLAEVWCPTRRSAGPGWPSSRHAPAGPRPC
ncbi:MAG: hypothetical protein QM662_11240 [Gordonia sp. (in: high G+C Gram-positive bacteria)]